MEELELYDIKWDRGGSLSREEANVIIEKLNEVIRVINK
jgi:hypothetical protein